ncbi:MAG: U32 family peptidase [Clostridia bacterium]|nr:U32 family peptidase [Clostridia bacterium]
MNGCEILAPAGGIDSVYAAVRCGANAVYLGSKAFNARRNAANFSYEELKTAVDYCHSHGVKVYLTLNTLVNDSELKTASEEIERACSLPADALLLQDLGLVKIIKEIAPGMPLHASTQMSVQSAQGVKLLEEAGFSRVVLARELSLDEIKEIRRQTKAELEVFVHGALCMCVSGQCLLSAALGGRSGNRGLCAQPCRLPFGVNGAQGHALSLKDMSVVENLAQLKEAGVVSFKIEGRMKRPEYVAAAVTACVKSLEGNYSAELARDLQSVFSRSGFTDGYLKGQRGPQMFGTRRREDVQSAAPVLKKLENLYDKETPLIPVDFALTCVENEPLSLGAGARGKNVFIKSEVVPQTAVNRAVTADELKERVAKCGGTQFYAENVDVELGANLSVSASAVNALRRDALQALGSAFSDIEPVKCEKYAPSPNRHKVQGRQIKIRLFRDEQLPANLNGIREVILPLDAGEKAYEKCRDAGVDISVEIPRAFFGNDEKFRSLLLKAKQNGAAKAVAGTLDGLKLAFDEKMPAGAGFGMNVFNTQALEFLESYGVKDALVSPELTLKQISALGGVIERGLVAYGFLPLMLTRNCPVRTAADCSRCKGRSHLTDRMGIDFPVICSHGCSELLNSRPVYLADRLNEIHNVDYILLYFTNETREECEKIIDAYKNGKPPEGGFTRGLYYRGVE